MANPFGLPKAVLAEREARRRWQFQAGIYAVLTTATVLIMGMLIQGCRTQPPPGSAGTITQDPVVRVRQTTPRQTVNPLPTPMATSITAEETNWISPQSTSLPENVTLPEPPPAPAPVAQTIEPTLPPSLPETPVHMTSPHHAKGIYVVKSGDTLSRIAKAHGISVKALKIANHLKSDRIFAGEKLKL